MVESLGKREVVECCYRIINFFAEDEDEPVIEPAYWEDSVRYYTKKEEPAEKRLGYGEILLNRIGAMIMEDEELLIEFREKYEEINIKIFDHSIMIGSVPRSDR